MNHLLKMTLVISALLILCTLPAQAEVHNDHHQEGTHQEAITLQLDHGKPWATDASLRQGMERVYKAVSLAQTASVDGVLNKAVAQTLRCLPF